MEGSPRPMFQLLRPHSRIPDSPEVPQRPLGRTGFSCCAGCASPAMSSWSPGPSPVANKTPKSVSTIPLLQGSVSPRERTGMFVAVPQAEKSPRGNLQQSDLDTGRQCLSPRVGRVFLTMHPDEDMVLRATITPGRARPTAAGGGSGPADENLRRQLAAACEALQAASETHKDADQALSGAHARVEELEAKLARLQAASPQPTDAVQENEPQGTLSEMRSPSRRGEVQTEPATEEPQPGEDEREELSRLRTYAEQLRTELQAERAMREKAQVEAKAVTDLLGKLEGEASDADTRLATLGAALQDETLARKHSEAVQEVLQQQLREARAAQAPHSMLKALTESRWVQTESAARSVAEEKLAEDLAVVIKELQGVSARLSEAEREKEKAVAEVRELTSRLQQVETLRGHVEGMQCDLQKQLAERDRELSELKSRLASSQAAQGQLSKALEGEKVAHAKTNAQLLSTAAQLEETQLLKQKAEGCMQALSGRLTQLQKSVLQSSNSSESIVIEQINDESESLKTQLSSLERKQRKAEQAAKADAAARAAAEKERDALRQQLEKLQEAYDSMKTTADKETAALLAEKESLQGKAEENRSQLCRAQTQSRQMADKLRTVSQDKDELRDKLNEMQAERDAALGRILDLQSRLSSKDDSAENLSSCNGRTPDPRRPPSPTPGVRRRSNTFMNSPMKRRSSITSSPMKCRSTPNLEVPDSDYPLWHDPVFLGLKLTPPVPKRAGSPLPRGLLVSEVIPNSPAAEAGLRSGDVLLTWDMVPVTNAMWSVLLKTARPGSRAFWVYSRGGKETTVEVVPEEPRPSRAGSPALLRSVGSGISDASGMMIGGSPTVRR
eukprot:RCo053133